MLLIFWDLDKDYPNPNYKEFFYFKQVFSLKTELDFS